MIGSRDVTSLTTRASMTDFTRFGDDPCISARVIRRGYEDGYAWGSASHLNHVSQTYKVVLPAADVYEGSEGDELRPARDASVMLRPPESEFLEFKRIAETRVGSQFEVWMEAVLRAAEKKDPSTAQGRMLSTLCEKLEITNSDDLPRIYERAVRGKRLVGAPRPQSSQDLLPVVPEAALTDMVELRLTPDEGRPESILPELLDGPYAHTLLLQEKEPELVTVMGPRSSAQAFAEWARSSRRLHAEIRDIEAPFSEEDVSPQLVEVRLMPGAENPASALTALQNHPLFKGFCLREEAPALIRLEGPESTAVDLARWAELHCGLRTEIREVDDAPLGEASTTSALFELRLTSGSESPANILEALRNNPFAKKLIIQNQASGSIILAGPQASIKAVAHWAELSGGVRTEIRQVENIYDNLAPNGDLSQLRELRLSQGSEHPDSILKALKGSPFADQLVVKRQDPDLITLVLPASRIEEAALWAQLHCGLHTEVSHVELNDSETYVAAKKGSLRRFAEGFTESLTVAGLINGMGNLSLVHLLGLPFNPVVFFTYIAIGMVMPKVVNWLLPKVEKLVDTPEFLERHPLLRRILKSGFTSFCINLLGNILLDPVLGVVQYLPQVFANFVVWGTAISSSWFSLKPKVIDKLHSRGKPPRQLAIS